MERYQIETLVIGAGVIGIAVARALAMTGHKVWLLEREPAGNPVTEALSVREVHALAPEAPST